VVGNNAYPSAPLRNAVADANEVSKALRDLQFDVTTLSDSNLVTLERAVEAFAARLQPSDVALFYFSGHGVQVDGENYLVPVDFKGIDEVDVKHLAYSASRVHDKLEAHARIRIIVLDACRDNPFRSTRSVQRGLATMTASGSLIAFATGPGSTASDNPRGKNGLFTEKLLEALKEPGLSTSELFRKVRLLVNNASGGRQTPWLWDGLIGDFVFRAGARPSLLPEGGVATDSASVLNLGRVGRENTTLASHVGPPQPVISRTLSANAGSAYGLSVSPGSRLVAVGYETGVVKVWDPGTGREIASLAGQVGAVTAVAMSPDSRHLAATSGDHTVRIWDLERGVEAARLVGHGDNVLAVTFSPDGRTVATGGADGTVRVWDVESGAPRDVLNGHRDWVTALAFSRDGRILVSGGRDRTARVWDLTRGRETMTLDVAAAIWSVAAARDLDLIAGGTEDGTIIVWDGDSGRVKWTGRPHKGAVWATAFSSDTTLLASGGADGVVQTWRANTGTPVQKFSGHTAWVRGVAFDDTTSWLVSSSGDGDVRTWRLSR
jgi:WD40 repeat protein